MVLTGESAGSPRLDEMIEVDVEGGLRGQKLDEENPLGKEKLQTEFGVNL